MAIEAASPCAVNRSAPHRNPSSWRQGAQSLAKPVWIEATDRAIAASLAKQQEQNLAEPMGPPWPRPKWKGSHRQTRSRASTHDRRKSGSNDNGAIAKQSNQLPQAKGRNGSQNYPPRGKIGQISQPKGPMWSQLQASSWPQTALALWPPISKT